ncbi:5-formyltetrahydrofolate cyclo-ligase [Lacinutrix sp. 5H-3-7-4]|uniref:5-formyltetrahydrofolate cyclo-ligase n=1 Tax=Lacinutrix sp. (strain 5H-3-7-4) TaxID=983544 RepID=UPI00020A33B7|nr:5-formyltetrahydrofolate cyclo-ligase [Lacinutrix sp. 5H-3-7-4]AEH00668.1 5-formyltetrahydrofolate cyclo-ligase [Lacinutrix sp. 5H-3-7-4]
MTKTQLREKYTKLRQELSTEETDSKSMDIANNLLKLDIWNHNFYHLFLTIENKKEVNTDYILNILSGKDKNIVISKSNFKNNTMDNFLLTDNTLIKANKYGIPEPTDGIPIDNSKIQVVFIPLLAYDKKGNRVGYGKGFYDTFLKSCTVNTIKIGLSFFEPETEIKDVYIHDIAMDYCITPKKIHIFNTHLID